MQLTFMSLNSLLHSINEIGILPNDDGLTVNRKRFVVYEAIGMSFGGLLWGIICIILGKFPQSHTPFVYVILSAINVTYFALTENFRFVQGFQTGISLLLPFIFHPRQNFNLAVCEQFEAKSLVCGMCGIALVYIY